MIEELGIRSLGVIDDAVVSFDPGLTVVTGETGAGKTMVITGLGLLLGARGEAGTVRLGSERAEVEGRFQVEPGSGVTARVEDAGGSVDDRAVILRRSVAAQGRSRAQVGGVGVPLAVLSQLAPDLVMVHGQSDQRGLLQPSRQRGLLDAYGTLDGCRSEYRRAYAAVQDIERRLTELDSNRADRRQEADLLRFGVAEIARVAPRAGEEVELKQEEDRLAHADELHRAAASARAAVDDDSDRTIIAALAHVRRLLDGVRAHDPALASLADRAAELGYLATELATELSAYLDSAAADPTRLAAVGERRAELSTLTRKYGASDVEVLAWADRAAERLVDLDATDDDLSVMREELAAARKALVGHALELSSRRSQAAADLATAITVELVDLAMPDASVTIEVTQRVTAEGLVLPDGRTVEAHPDGIDDVVFLLRPHADSAPRPIAKGASGGELSRIMLALEVVLAGVDSPPTLVFDEVDAGVGGRAAVEVGRRLAVLSRIVQVIVVTHLPQVAAFADRHLVVTKSSDGLVTSSDIQALDDAGRARELARMLAGLEDSELGRAHATELLALADRVKAQGS